jgi:hypothetical protein
MYALKIMTSMQLSIVLAKSLQNVVNMSEKDTDFQMV